nr:MAG: replication associated protein [Cressdnaviricota sp.]
MSRHRAWCFTINNYSSTDEFAVKYLFKKAKYGIYGQEIGAKGTPHLQGYIHLENALSLDVMRKSLTRAHLTVANGSDEDNKRYCSKEGKNIYEVGEISIGQGTRTDIKEIAKKIKDREITLEDLMFDYPEMYVKYSRSFEKMINAVSPARSVPPKVFWRWGLSGTGKTRYCVEKHPDHYIKDGTSWWDNYKTNEAIIIDDFDNQIPYRTLLRMLDRYDFQGQIKGGYVRINSPFIYITCEHPPEYYWGGNELQQIKRRLTSVEEIK